MISAKTTKLADHLEVDSDDMEELDPVFMEIGKMFQLVDKASTEPNHERIDQMKHSYNLIKKLGFDGEDVTISDLPEHPVQRTDAIIINAKSIEFSEPEKFLEAIEHVDVFSVYPKVDGTLDIELTFNRLMTIPQEEI